MTSKQSIPAVINNLEKLTTTIQEVNTYFLTKVQKQVNTSLTLRNWLIGFILLSMNRAVKTGLHMARSSIRPLSERLAKRGLKSIRERNDSDSFCRII